MLYKGLKGAASIPTNDLVPPVRHVRKHHSLAFQTPFTNTDIYMSSFFPQTVGDWNLLSGSLLSAAEDSVLFFFLSIHTATPSLENYEQVYTVHAGFAG